jgi:4-hydroxyphenylpyruvate dioxygenase
VLTTPLKSSSPINEHIVKHGDGVKVIALWVEDARSAWEETTKRGAKSYMEPTVEKDEHGEVVRSGIYTYGETVHMFVERKTIMEHFYLDLLNGNQIIILNHLV